MGAEFEYINIGEHIHNLSTWFVIAIHLLT